MRQTESHLAFLSNISIVTVGNPLRIDNAWNEDHSQNVYAQRRIVKLQVWESLSSIYCLNYTAVVVFPELSTEADSISELSLEPSSLKLVCQSPLTDNECVNTGIVK